MVELLVVVGILSVLVAVLFVTLDPLTQINKAQNAVRVQGLASIKSALESYFTDQACYPRSLSFGNNLTYNSKLYASLPEDPDCHKGGWCYVYQTDGSACPQWYVIYFSLQVTNSNLSAQCPLVSQTNCVPQNFSYSHYNACITSTDYNCNYISQQNIIERQ